MAEEGRVHPDCRNASNPYHECSEFCFQIIATKKKMNKVDTGLQAVDDNITPDMIAASNQREATNVEKDGGEDHTDEEGDGIDGKEDDAAKNFANLTGKQKKLFELRLKMNEARKANQIAMVAEKKKMEGPVESRGISKQKWLEERKKKIGKLLDANGLDMSKAYMLDTEEMAESKYKKWEKEPAPSGWDVFNQKTLYNAYKKRTKNIELDLDEYNKMKEADPEFYREASSLQYGKAPKISEEKVDKMVKELKDREEKSRAFSRRRKYREEKDIDSINDRNEHFNKKIERAFGKYTLEIKNNLERGTALPD
ncbi:Cyclin D-interacting protein GCIP [Handroanthus impetiginosus]|uniref:Pre-mRNA-splicing factor SYF2 n=1 Tax=Handroanthus impetiginosus TaxID=429701 RepID=A0A2G9GC55_9LAMI|nr:Cyclin D-interacting protein GCIP [Handroanthus impetiginosus]